MQLTLFDRVATLLGKLGWPGKVREFENWPKKTGNLKINQKIKEKSGNCIMLTDWQSPIEQTSRQCWKQNVLYSGLGSHTCDFWWIREDPRITYSWVHGNLRIIHLISQDSTIIKISYCEILKTLHSRF